MTVEYTIAYPRLAQDAEIFASRLARIGCLVALAIHSKGWCNLV